MEADIKKDFILVVPDEKQVRLAIRKRIDEYFISNEVLPPVSFESLVNHSAKLIDLFNWDPKYQAFVMICCGNAVWRRVVEAIPYNRRVLLLPQCLKNSTYCKARSDQFGLLCENCGKCSISGYIEEAENLGYVVLVTEGTTVTSQLIESGKIDAVIGVGCMEVLQKIFDSVQKFSVPGIGIPLLTCGCKDTMADADWIREEVHNIFESRDVNLLNLNHIISKTTKIFHEDMLKEILSISGEKSEQLVLKSMLAGGHRFRPFFAVLTYQAFIGQPDDQVLHRLAVSVECFHKASLIHDDIEDGDTTRYGVETIHAEHGIPVAINTGDLLIGEGYRLISEIKLPSELIQQCLKVISEGHKKLALGQGAELFATSDRKILPLNDILNVFDLKTASSFRVSLLLGATVGGADLASLTILDKFSKNLGIAYQIQDDLDDFMGDRGDIEVRGFSILLSLLNERLSDEDEKTLSDYFLSNDYDSVYRLIEVYKIMEEVENLLNSYLERAKSNLNELHNLGLRLALNEILGKIFPKHF